VINIGRTVINNLLRRDTFLAKVFSQYLAKFVYTDAR